MNSSWEQNASAANDSGDWGGWVVELELLQSQQIKIIYGKCMLRCQTIPLIGEAGVVEVERLQS